MSQTGEKCLALFFIAHLMALGVYIDHRREYKNARGEETEAAKSPYRCNEFFLYVQYLIDSARQLNS
jgi:hypothetical protein